MATAQLSATPRDGTGKGVARTLRREGKIPGIIYGHGRDSKPLAVSARDLDKLLEHISAESTVIELSLDGTSARTLIREIQRHPFKRQILHIDFQELVAGEKVMVRIPLILTGIPEGVRLSGGVLDQTMRELHVRVDPSNIPNKVELDVTPMQIGTSMHVSDLTLPEGVEVLDDEESTVAVLAAPRAVIEAAVAPEAAEAPAEPEVIRAKKPEEGEGETPKK